MALLVLMNRDETEHHHHVSRISLPYTIHMPCGFLVATTDVAYVALVSYLAVEVAHDHAN